MANTIVERDRCLHAVVNDSVCGSGSDLFLMRSTITHRPVPSNERLLWSRNMLLEIGPAPPVTG